MAKELPDSKRDEQLPQKRDVKELIESLREMTKSEGLLARLVIAVKASNDLAKGNNLRLRLLSFGLVACIVILVGVSLAMWRTAVKLEENRQLTAQAIEDLKRTDRKVDDVKENQEEAVKAEAEKPKLELVPETDPEKAKVAPIKVRISAPQEPSVPASDKPAPNKRPPAVQGPPVPTVELPLPLKDGAALQ